jgi:hypothetical protein
MIKGSANFIHNLIALVAATRSHGITTQKIKAISLAVYDNLGVSYCTHFTCSDVHNRRVALGI